MGWRLRASLECTDHMLVYGSSKPSNLLLTVVWLSPLLLWLWGGEKLDGDTQIGQSACWGFSQEFLFLRSSDFVQLYRRLCEKVAIRRPHEIRMVDGHTRTEREKCVVCWSSFSLQGVHQFELSQLLDMSTTCLWQSSRSKLMNLMSLM
jgi:hypothetical protein